MQLSEKKHMALSAVTDKNFCKCNDNKGCKTMLEHWYKKKKTKTQPTKIAIWRVLMGIFYITLER